MKIKNREYRQQTKVESNKMVRIFFRNNGIPDTIDGNHGIHMIPCYKKFTLILSSQSKETFTQKRLT